MDDDAVTAVESDPVSEVAVSVPASSEEDSPVEIVGIEVVLPVGRKQPGTMAHARSPGRGFMVVRAVIDRPRSRLKVPAKRGCLVTASSGARARNRRRRRRGCPRSRDRPRGKTA
jgi:hypothetical protein